MIHWDVRRKARQARIANGMAHTAGKVVAADKLVAFLEAVIVSGDRVCLEGDNQKQADMLARALAEVDPAKIRDLHMIQSGVTGRRAGSATGRSRIMETLRFELAAPTSANGVRKTALVGGVASGNLEVLLEREGLADRRTIEINTSAHGFTPLWEAVV
jgi:Malonate decarboxylase, alpha subunit, transporter/Malonate decarboxylase delta subunit (MdcD)